MEKINEIEFISCSTKSWEDAASRAVNEALHTLKGIFSVKIQNHSCSIKDGKINEYRVNAKIAVKIENT